MRCLLQCSVGFRSASMVRDGLAVITLVSAIHAQAGAALVANYTIGSGANTSFVQFDFANSNTYLYEINYDGAMTGRGLFTLISAAQPNFFQFTFESYSFGDFVTGITIGNDTDAGYGTPPDYLDYWHYWTRGSSTDAWTESFVGFADRSTTNGSWDGWVFNSAGAPSAVPTPGALALVAMVGLTRRRRR